MAGVSVADGGSSVAAMTVLLICVLAQVVHGVSPSAPSSFETFWLHELPGVAMPSSLLKAASPLSPYADRLLFAQLLAGSDPRLLSDKLCSSAPVYCAQKYVVYGGSEPRVCIPPFFNYEYGVLPCQYGASEVAQVAKSGIFFPSSTLSLGQTVQFPDTANDLSNVAFLSNTIAGALPVNLDHWLELQSLFGVPAGSQMELDMVNTAVHCSAQSDSHEVRGCQSSGEALVSFVSQNLGEKVIVLSVPALSKQEVKVTNVRPVNMNGEKSVICHSMKFPSLVYSCHMTSTTQVFDVSVVKSEGKIEHALGVCHADTSYWNPSHIAFKVLNTEPGKDTICHWLPENTLVFVQRSGI